MTASISSSLLSFKTHQPHFLSSGSSLKSTEKFLLGTRSCNLYSKARVAEHRRTLTIQARSDDGKSSTAGIFIGGFVLGGIVAGTLGCVFSPQISKALTETDRKDLMRKLPKFIYDEEKALERTRKVLAEKISQLNNAIDEVSVQLHADDAPNGVAVASDEVEAST